MNETVKTVRVQLKKVAVQSFSPNDNIVVFDIFFDDGQQQRRTATTELMHPNMLAVKLVEDIVCAEQDCYVDFDGEMLKEAAVVIEDEQRVRLMLIDFFRTLYSKAQQIRHMQSAEGYMNLLRSMQRCEIAL